MARSNIATDTNAPRTHEGAIADHITPIQELRRSVLTCLLFENTFYEAGSTTAARIAELCSRVRPAQIAALAVEARQRYFLRHVPLFLIAQLSKHAESGPDVAASLPQVIQRADELGEFLSIYWQYGARSGKSGRHPLSAGVKRGLAKAIRKFGAHQLAKYNGENSAIQLRDVLFLVHGKPADDEQAAIWKLLCNKRLPSPDTWEVMLSRGDDKKEAFERLIREQKLGGLAVLRNLRKMQEVGVDEALIRERLAQGIARALPFQFVTAARYAPRFEDAIEQAMLASLSDIEVLPGRTGLLVDVSQSMEASLSAGKGRTKSGAVTNQSQTTRLDAAAGLAILLRERCEQGRMATFSHEVCELFPRRGFALRDSIIHSQPHGGTHLAKAIQYLSRAWTDCDRLIVITDEQSQDGIADGFTKRNYLINVASYKNGVGYQHNFTHIDGWSEGVFDYIAAVEKEGA